MTRIYIITDLEGISGVSAMSQIENGTPEYHEACKRLMADTNAAIRGAFDGGADEVYVTDGHGGGNNFIEGELDERAIQCRIVNDPKFDITKIDAFMHVGTHALSGTQCAFLDHTQNSLKWHDYLINGKRSGELVQGALLAGAYDIPFIFVAGDQAACNEARRFFGDVKVAAVKYAVVRNEAICMPNDEAEQLIYEQAKASISLIGSDDNRPRKIKPYKVTMPMEVKVVFNRADYADDVARYRNDVERLDARTLRRVVDKIVTYYDVLM